PPDPKQLAQWTTELGSDDFKVRTRAMRELEDLGELAEPALVRAMFTAETLEARQRLELLLEKMDGPPTGEALRTVRAIGVLELLATAEARELLQTLAKGEPKARLTRAAQAALGRF